jgi:hypothetical protein
MMSKNNGKEQSVRRWGTEREKRSGNRIGGMVISGIREEGMEG